MYLNPKSLSRIARASTLLASIALTSGLSACSDASGNNQLHLTPRVAASVPRLHPMPAVQPFDEGFAAAERDGQAAVAAPVPAPRVQSHASKEPRTFSQEYEREHRALFNQKELDKRSAESPPTF